MQKQVASNQLQQINPTAPTANETICYLWETIHSTTERTRSTQYLRWIRIIGDSLQQGNALCLLFEKSQINTIYWHRHKHTHQ